jgi:hypothetical protein
MGKVLYRTDEYPGPEKLAEAVRKADPKYDPSKDPNGSGGLDLTALKAKAVKFYNDNTALVWGGAVLALVLARASQEAGHRGDEFQYEWPQRTEAEDEEADDVWGPSSFGWRLARACEAAPLAHRDRVVRVRSELDAPPSCSAGGLASDPGAVRRRRQLVVVVLLLSMPRRKTLA